MKNVIQLIFALASLAVVQAKPTLFIIGDSTVHNNSKGQMGWGEPLKTLFDTNKINVENHAMGGRSSRTFYTEGRWKTVLDKLQKGDYVLMQFGHNDNGPIFKQKARASIKGNGDEIQEGVVESTKKNETVHSFGWYIRQYVSTAKAKGATPVVLSLIPRNMWKDGKIGRATNDFTLWSKQAADQEHGEFLDFNKALADEYEKLGQETEGEFFRGSDHTHTNSVGATFNAHVLARELKNLSSVKLGSYLLPNADELPKVEILSPPISIPTPTPAPAATTTPAAPKPTTTPAPEPEAEPTSN